MKYQSPLKTLKTNLDKYQDGLNHFTDQFNTLLKAQGYNPKIDVIYKDGKFIVKSNLDEVINRRYNRCH